MHYTRVKYQRTEKMMRFFRKTGVTISKCTIRASDCSSLVGFKSSNRYWGFSIQTLGILRQETSFCWSAFYSLSFFRPQPVLLAFVCQYPRPHHYPSVHGRRKISAPISRVPWWSHSFMVSFHDSFKVAWLQAWFHLFCLCYFCSIHAFAYGRRRNKYVCFMTRTIDPSLPSPYSFLDQRWREWLMSPLNFLSCVIWNYLKDET